MELNPEILDVSSPCRAYSLQGTKAIEVRPASNPEILGARLLRGVPYAL
jgi:hypothetical protein